DRVVLGDIAPVADGLLVAVAGRGVLGEGEVGVGDRGEAHRGQAEVVDGAGLAPGVGVGPAGHAGADHGDGERGGGHGTGPSGSGGAGDGAAGVRGLRRVRPAGRPTDTVSAGG